MFHKCDRNILISCFQHRIKSRGSCKTLTEKIVVISTAKTLVFSGSWAVKAFLMTRLAGLSFLNVVLSVRAVSRCHTVPVMVQCQAISASKAGSGRRTSLACPVACWNGQTVGMSPFLVASRVIISALILQGAAIISGWEAEGNRVIALLLPSETFYYFQSYAGSSLCFLLHWHCFCWAVVFNILSPAILSTLPEWLPIILNTSSFATSLPAFYNFCCSKLCLVIFPHQLSSLFPGHW